MAKVMVLCGGNWQVDLVKKIKQMGHYVINTNLYENSPAFSYADTYEIADILDKERNLQIAKKHSPDAIVTDQSDIAVPTVAYLNEQLGLPGIGSEKAELFTNKYKMRLFCKENGFPAPEFAFCTSITQAERFLEKHKNIVIKPSDSQSSRGVFFVNSKSKLQTHYEQAYQFSNHHKGVLVEQFIQGTEFTVEGIQTAKGHTTLAISEKSHYDEYPMVASALVYTHSHGCYNYPLLREQNNSLVNKMALPFGLTHAEYIYSNGLFYLVEIAARGGGTNISSQVVPYMSGFDTNLHLVRMALGEYPPHDFFEISSDIKNHAAALVFFNFKAGRVLHISGTEILQKHPFVIGWRLNFKEGESIPLPTDDSVRPGHYLLAAPSYEQLLEARLQIESQIKVEYYEAD